MALNKKLLFLVACLSVFNKLQTAPLLGNTDGFCDGQDTLKYEFGYEYRYDYSTRTQLWISDVSEESKTIADLKATVVVRSISPCRFLLRIEDPTLTGESVEKNVDLSLLVLNPVSFGLNSRGELSSTLSFTQGDEAWSRNIKRGILSALQTKSTNDLRELDGQLDSAKSAVVYETDVLGRCRTTYSVAESNAAQLVLQKSKSLHGCTLNNNLKSSAVHFSTYRSMPEFYQGRLFIETYECKTIIKNGLIDQVECDEQSTYKISSRGQKGVQAVVKQSLKFVEKTTTVNKMALGDFDDLEINFEYAQKSTNDLESSNLNANEFLSDLCKRAEQKNGLDFEHSNNFKSLVNQFESLKSNDLVSLFNQYNSKCKLAGMTVAQAIVLANTDESFSAALQLLDNNHFADHASITEYPILSALARNKQPSAELINKLKNYLLSKNADFPYLRKLLLVYSSMVKTHCSVNQCDEAKLDNLSSFLGKNLGSNCEDASNKDLVVVTLKAIGNIGFFKNAQQLTSCLENKKNSLETRVSSIQAFRRFSCDSLAQPNLAALRNLLKDQDEDTELRINVFQLVVKCSENEQFIQMAQSQIPEFLEKETNIQFLTYVVDYAKEHGITLLLNPMLSNPQLREKFSVNFKELSWNNFKYTYSLSRDGALELDTSVVYASDRSFVPRSIRVNGTLHLFGMSVNFLDATLRLEGMDNVLKAVLVDKLTGESLLNKLTQQPEQILQLVKAIVEKLNYSSEKPYASLSIKLYGSEIFFSELNNSEKLLKVGKFLRNPRESLLYAQVNAIKNVFLIDSNVRQPLMNGFEFNTFMDVSASLLIQKESSKKDLPNEKREFVLNNLHGLSVAVNRRFEIHLTNDLKNRLALKKKAFINLRLRLDATGTKQQGAAQYQLNLTPSKDLPLLVIDGKFFKLSANNQYKEITQFSVEQKRFENCTSSNFHNAFGVDLCLTFNRPKLGASLFELLKPVDLDSVLANQDDDDEEEEQENEDRDEIYGNLNRPKITLSGPYHYQINLRNTDLVKSLIFRAQLKKEESLVDFFSSLATVSANNQEENRLEFVYTRNRVETNRKFERIFNAELRLPKTGETRFRASGDLIYHKQEKTQFKFEVDNKVLREFHVLFNVNREIVSEEDIVPSYTFEALLNSKLRNEKFYRAFFEIVPSGKEIKSDLIVEVSNPSTNNQMIKLVDALLTLTPAQDAKLDYQLDLQVETARPSKLHLYGNLAADLFKSLIDLSLEYDGPRFKLNEPASIKLAHSLDLSGNSKNSFEFGLKLPNLPVDHNLRVIVDADVTKLQLNSVELQLRSPRSQLVDGIRQPFIFFVSRQKSEDGSYELNVALSNFAIDLSQRAQSSKLAAFLVGVDAKNEVNSLNLRFARFLDSQKNSRNLQLSIKKNEVEFVNLDGSFYSQGQELNYKTGGSLNVKVKDFSGQLQTSLELNDNKNGQLNYKFDLTSENLIRILLKIISINSNAQIDTNSKKVDFQFEIKKLGEVRSVKLASTNGQLRVGSINPTSKVPTREFDISYEKIFANGQNKKSNGLVKFIYVPSKKLETVVDVKNSLESTFVLRNEGGNEGDLQRVNEMHLKYAHLDEQIQSEREFRILVDKKQETGLVSSKHYILLAKKGEKSKFNDLDSLNYLIDINTKNSYLASQRINGENSVGLKLQMIKLNWKSNMKNDLKTQQKNTQIELNTRFPAFFTDPTKSIQSSQKFAYARNLASQKRTLTYSLETDSERLNRHFNRLTLDYTREPLLTDSKTINGILNLNLFKSGSQKAKTLNMKIERRLCENNEQEDEQDDENDDALNDLKDSLQICSGTRVEFQQDILPQFESRYAQGKTIDLSKCLAETKLIRQKNAKEYLLDALVSLTCQQTTLVRNSLLIHRQKQNQASLNLKLDLQSDLYYEQRLIEFNHKKFRSTSGLFEMSLIRPKFEFTQRFSYERDLNQVNGDLSSATYKLSSVKLTGTDKYSRTCEWNIDAKGANYFNKFACKAKTPKLPAETSYGFSLRANNYKELIFGKRDLQFDLNLPTGRSLRVEYNGERASPVDTTQFDNDEDQNNDREFKGVAKFYWDLTRQPNRFVQVNVKRDNYAQTNSKLTLEVTNIQGLKAYRFILDRQRLFNETRVQLTNEYELESNNAANNRLDLTFRMSSDLDTNFLSTELNLQRPQFNILYENKFNKLNGRLENLNLRFGKLLALQIQKDDPENRKISVQFASPSNELYSVESLVKESNKNLHHVESKLKDANGQVLGVLSSKFNAKNNQLDLHVNSLKNAAQTTYQLNFGLFNESLANARLLRNDEKMGVASLGIHSHDDHSDLEFTLRWNRVWNQFKQDLLGKSLQSSSASFNSYFGDVYAELQTELKPLIERVRQERKALQQELMQSFGIAYDYNSYYLPKSLKERIENLLKSKMIESAKEEQEFNQLPLYKRVFRRYNQLADKLKILYVRVKGVSKRLAKLIPRLPKLNYNDEKTAANQIDRTAPAFDNNLIVSRPTSNSFTLYQFNAEYRDRLRQLGQRVLSVKSGLLRNLMSRYTLRSLINKYKFRSLNDYTMIASVFNKRNVIAFNGELRVLKSKCRYLLAHEFEKNQFSILLNNVNEQEEVLSVSAFGQSFTFDLSSTQAKQNNKALPLPFTLSLGAQKQIQIRRLHNGVQLELNNDLQVTCYQDSKSCTIALTRFYTGKVNGLLGKSNQDLNLRQDENEWYLDSKCQSPLSATLRKPSLDVVKQCYTLFGKQRRALFRDAFQVIRPTGWQRLCENALNVDASLNNRCTLLRAFVYHARERDLQLNEPNECFSCSANNQQFNVNKEIDETQSSDLVEQGVDHVFVFLPCQKNLIKPEMLNVFKSVVSSDAQNRYYIVKVDQQNGASIYQNENGQTYNFKNLEQALNEIADNGQKQGEPVNKESFYRGLFLAANLLSQRVASQRKLIIVSCGNCLPYSPFASLRLSKLLNQRNIMISSYSTSYSIVDQDTNEKLVGYGQENVFVYDSDEKTVGAESLESYNPEHRADLCHRLAQKTNGYVFDLNFVNEPKVFKQVVEMQQQNAPKYEQTIKQCVRLDTPFGDFDDFIYEQTQVQEDDLDE